MKGRTRIMVELSFSMKSLKEAYRKYYGGEKEKVLKEDVARLLGNLVSADLDSILYDTEEDEEDENFPPESI
jgi:hypothetical protein